jgi:hypothetical protein
MNQKEFMDKAELSKQNDQIKILKDSMNKESDQLKLKNKELMNQVDQLKKQLQLMNEKKPDSINQAKPITPKSQTKPIKSDIKTDNVAINLLIERNSIQLH